MNGWLLRGTFFSYVFLLCVFEMGKLEQPLTHNTRDAKILHCLHNRPPTYKTAASTIYMTCKILQPSPITPHIVLVVAYDNTHIIH